MIDRVESPSARLRDRSAIDRVEEPSSLTLVVQGRSRTWWISGLIAMFIVPSLLIGAALGIDQGLVPWITRSRHISLLLAVFALMSVLPSVVGIVTYTQARVGRVEFHAERVVFTKETGSFAVPWTEIGSFRDDSADFVQLLRAKPDVRDRFGSFRLTVPTLSERSRVAVLDLLVRKGLPRA